MGRAIVTTEILWQGNAISCMKTFGKPSCRLCMQERLFIYKALRNEKQKHLVINSANELFGACRHKPNFHRFNMLQNPSADDGQTSPEKSFSEGYSTNFNQTVATNQMSSTVGTFCTPVTVEI